MSLPLRPSPAWDFFDKSNDSSHVTCRKCKAEFKFFGSTTVMIKHVEAHHIDDLNKMQQFKMKNGCNGRSSLSEATDKYVLSLCTSNVPFNIVKNEHFRSFIHQLNPDYQLLTTDGIRRKLATTAKVYRDSVKKTLKKANRCIITLDGWDGRYENTSLYALFLYFIDAEFSRHKLFLGIQKLDGKIDAEKIGKFVENILLGFDFDIGKIIGGMCDGGSNIKSFLKKNDKFHLHCGAHSLALIIKAVSEINSVKNLFLKINKLAAHLSRSKNGRQRFKERSKILKILGRIPLPFSPTRWGGSVLLAQAYFDHYESITALDDFQEFLLTNDEKSVLNEFLEFTKPYIEAIQMSERDQTLFSEILVVYAGLLDFISGATHQKEIVRVLKSETASRFDALLGNDLATFAIYCDPRFAYLPGILKTITWSNIENEVETYCDSIRVVTTDSNGTSHVAPPVAKKVKDDGSFFSRFVSSRRDVASTDSTRSEIVSYQSMIQSSRPPTSSDPLHFWALNAEKFPNLSVLANHSLASPSSAAPVERLFSQCGHMISSPRRNRLLPATLNNMILCAALADLEKGLRDDDDSEESSEENIDDEDDGNNNNNSFNPANNASSSSAVPSVPPPISINSFSSPPVLSSSPQPPIISHSSPSSAPGASPISPNSPHNPNNS
ncbi:unnamed protein product [Caenorhabditis nigoni]